MGLPERRALKQYQDEQFPKLAEGMDQAAGFPVPLQVQWSELMLEGQAEAYAEGFTRVFFEPLTLAFRRITRDELGQAALRDGLRQVVVRYSGSRSGQESITFENGVLTIDQSPVTRLDYVEERVQQIVQKVERSL